ncbi:MAG: hypothetical protein HUJ91_07420 [Bacteroidales bacterium]|nr:hypothetical protein [Bacteroidales bacterium]
MKRYIIPTVLMVLSLGVASCYKDLGNYEYSEIPEITVENLPEMITVLASAEPIVITPTIKSSIEGVIDESNPNFELGCQLITNSGLLSTGQRTLDMNPEHKKDVNYLCTERAGNYTIWYTVTDKRTGVKTNFTIPLTMTSATYQGWLLLCDEGDENKVRLDMVSWFSKDRIIPAYNLLGGKVELKNARHIMFSANALAAAGDVLWINTDDGTYELNRDNLTTDPTYCINGSYFINDPKVPVVFTEVAKTGFPSMMARYAVTSEGDLYRLGNVYGSAFENKANTLVMDGEPNFKVAPFVGIPRRYQNQYQALFYDITNKRFLYCPYDYNYPDHLSVLSNDKATLFDWTTGKDIVSMKGCAFGNYGVVYTILEDASHNRTLYGIDNNAWNHPVQTLYKELTGEGIKNATCFTYHDQYAYMFYNNGENKIASYNMGDNTYISDMVTLDGEEITYLGISSFLVPTSYRPDTSDEFDALQHLLMVGSYKKGATDNNGGIFRLYKFDQNARTLTKVYEFSGFAKIRDAVYNERW